LANAGIVFSFPRVSDEEYWIDGGADATVLPVHLRVGDRSWFSVIRCSGACGSFFFCLSTLSGGGVARLHCGAGNRCRSR
jgi:hypothetical protein